MSGASIGRIFVSYRRDDTQHVAGRLADWIAQRFGEGHVFMDVDSIEPGVDFAQAIEDAVGSCDALIALIGPEWTTVVNERGGRRLDDPDDFVYLEVTAALSRGVRVIPVLVDGAVMPPSSDLPAALAPLTRRNAARLDHESFRLHAGLLIDSLAKMMLHRTAVPSDVSASVPGASADEPDQPALAAEPSQATSRTVPGGVEGTDVFNDPDYVKGLAAFFTERWPEAIAHFEGVLGRHPDDPQITNRIALARSRQLLITSDHHAGAAAQEQRWHDAIAALERIVAVEPGYNDASARLEYARRQAKIGDVQADIRRLHAAGSWAAVVAAGDVLGALDPDIADPDALVDAARGELKEAGRAATYALALRHMDRSKWATAIETLEPLQYEYPGYRDTVTLLAYARAQLDPGPTGTEPNESPSESEVPHETGRVSGVSERPARVRASSFALGQPDLTFSGHTAYVYSVAFSPDGRTLASGADKTVRLWDPATGKEVRTLTGHASPVHSVAFSPDGRTLASGGADKTVRLWDPATGKEIRTLTGAGNRVESVAFSPDGRTLASGGADKTVRLWDPATGQEIRTLTGHASPVYSVAFSPDGRTLASGAADKTVRLWDPATGKEIRTLTGHAGWVYSVAFSPDGRTLASGSDDKTVRLWDPATGKEVRTLTGHDNWVYSVAFSPESEIVVSGGGGGVFRGDNVIRIWTSDGDVCSVPRWGKQIRSIAFSPSGHSFAVGSENMEIALWNLV